MAETKRCWAARSAKSYGDKELLVGSTASSRGKLLARLDPAKRPAVLGGLTFIDVDVGRT